MGDESPIFEQDLRRVAQDAARASGMLQATRRYVQARFTRDDTSGGWRQFLNEDGPPTVTGTACIVSSLIRIGVSRRDERVRAGADLLLGRVRPDGGWSKPELEAHVSVTLITCLALRALVDLDLRDDHATVANGLAWLERAQNEDGGWGGLPADDRSDVTATSYALKVLALSEGHSHDYDGALERGCRWLHSQQRPGSGWGQRQGMEPTVAHTSHALEALLAAGTPRAEVEDVQRWLNTELISHPLAPWAEHYTFTRGHAATLPPHMLASRLSWTHLPAERSLIVLLKLGLDLTSDTVRRLIDDLASRHMLRQYWQVQTIPGAAPAWAILEAVDALSLYLRQVERTGDLTVVSRLSSDLTSRLAVLEADGKTFNDRLGALEQRIDELESRRLARRTAIPRRLRALKRLLSTPLAAVITVVVVTGAALALYLNTGDNTDDLGERLIGISTILATALALLELARRRRHR